MRREVAAGGKGRLLVNGSPAALKTLQEIAPRLLVLHGQAEARDLLDPDVPRQLLDRFAGLGEIAAVTAARFREFFGAERDLARLNEAAKDRVQRLELLEFQIAEIDEVGPKEGEDEEISSERKRLASVEKVGQLLAAATGALESDENGAIPAASAARRALQQLEEISSSYASRSASLAEAIERLREVAFETSRDLGSLEADPARAAFVAERLDALAKLKRKYGPTLSDVLERRVSLGRERDELLDLEGAVKKAEGASEKAFSAYRRAALELSAAREAAAPRLGRAVEAHLTDLAFLKSSFSVLVTRRDEEGSRFAAGGCRVSFGAHGIDQVGFAFAPNPGEPARPLQRIASGGELSRVQLALAAALAAEEPAAEEGATTGAAAAASGPSSSTRWTRASRARRRRPSAGSCAASRRRSRSSSSRISRRSPRPANATSPSRRRRRRGVRARASRRSTAPGGWRRSRRCSRGRPSGTRRAPRRASCSRHSPGAGLEPDLRAGLTEPLPGV